MAPRVSFILINYKSVGMIKQIIKSITGLNLVFSYEVIIVDNQSGDDLSWFQKNYPELQIITAKKNGGYASGCNLGLHKATGEYLLIMNPDLVLFKGSLEPLIKYADEHPEVGLCAPKLLNPDGSIQLSCRTWHNIKTILARRTPLALTHFGQQALSEHLVMTWDHNQSGPIPWVYGACFLVRRKAYEQIGGLDERYFLYFEDLDYCRTLWTCGWPVHYVTESIIVHYHHQDSNSWGGLRDALRPSTLTHIKSGVKYLWKWRGQEPPRFEPVWQTSQTIVQKQLL